MVTDEIEDVTEAGGWERLTGFEGFENEFGRIVTVAKGVGLSG